MRPTGLSLLAQRDRWERLGDRFSGEYARVDLSELAWLLFVAAGAVLTLWWLSALAKRIEGRIARPNPGRLFRELSHAHRLSRAERKLMQRLAAAAGEEHPATLFVRADLIAAARLPEEATAVESLREKLFAA